MDKRLHLGNLFWLTKRMAELKVLISGGSGFLGINLVRYLVSKGIQDIIVLDIADFDSAEKEKISFVKGDIRDKAVIAQVTMGVDLVIHAAAALPLYKKKEIYSTNVEGTKNLLEGAFRNGVDRFIHISSTAVYGIPEHHPLYETDKLSGVGDYGKSKIMAEALCENYRKKGMCVSILRPKSFIGPERLGVFSLLYEWAKDGRGFPVIGNGSNRYQLLDVEDLCEAIFLCATKNKRLAGDIFNIGAGEFGTIREDWQAVLDAAGHGKKIISFPAAPSLIVLRIFDFLRISPLYKWIYETVNKDSFVSIEKAETQLGFSPRYSNKQALIRNYRWYLENFNRFNGKLGISHNVPWNQSVLKVLKVFF